MKQFAEGMGLSLPFVQAVFAQMDEYVNTFSWADEDYTNLFYDAVDAYQTWQEALATGSGADKAKADLDELAGRIARLSDEDKISLGFTTSDVDIARLNELESTLKKMSEGGPVDLTMRPVIDTSKLAEAGFPEEPGGFATSYTHTFSNRARNVAINMTPILPDGSVMDAENFVAYGESVAEGAEDYLNLQIGATFTGKNAIEEASAVADEAHELQEEYYNAKNSIIDSIDDIIAKMDELFNPKEVPTMEGLEELFGRYDKMFTRYRSDHLIREDEAEYLNGIKAQIQETAEVIAQLPAEKKIALGLDENTTAETIS